MTDAWFSFAVVISVQLLLFVVHACYEKRLHEIPKIVAQGLCIGVIFGVAFDLVVGKVLGVYSYELGFNFTFLVINGALSYGLMQANTLLMQRAAFLHFYIWTLVVGVVYEVTNALFRVWTWEFSTPFIEVLVVHTVGYIGLATLMAFIWHIFLGHRFVFIARNVDS
jgi:Na+/citrate or Na+/malate symporter